MLPRGCYVIHHALFALAGLIGITGRLSPVLGIIPDFGLVLSIGLLIAGLIGIYARFNSDDEAEIIALRMMSTLSLAWGCAVLYSVWTSGSQNIMGGISLIAQSAVLWGLAQGIFKGYRADVEDIQAFMLILFEAPSTEPAEGEEDK
jgi:hypothetical protein